MTSITNMEPGTTAAERTSAVVDSGGVDSDGSRQRSARKTVVATSVVAVIAVISAVVGMVFPEMFAATVAVTVLALSLPSIGSSMAEGSDRPRGRIGRSEGQRTGDSIFESPVVAGEMWYAARESNPQPAGCASRAQPTGLSAVPAGQR